MTRSSTGRREPQTRERKTVLVTGCARSGTKYTAELLAAHGLDVRHEAMGRDGTVTWCMAVDDQEVPWGEPFGAYSFDHIFHQVRHPLPVIRSMMTLRPKSWEFIARHIELDGGEPSLLNAARFWYYWNGLAERRSNKRFRIEKVGEVQEVLLGGLSLTPSPEAFSVTHRETNTRARSKLYVAYEKAMIRLRLPSNPKVVSWLLPNDPENEHVQKKQVEEQQIWDELVASDPRLADKIAEKAASYGYDDLRI